MFHGVKCEEMGQLNMSLEVVLCFMELNVRKWGSLI